MAEKELTLVLRVVHSVRLVGLWFGAEGDIVHILAKFSIFCYLSIYVLQLIALVIARDDPARMFECFSVIFFCGMGILKLFSLKINHNYWLRLLNRMARLENDQRTLEAATDQSSYDKIQTTKCIEVYTANFKRTSLILYRIYMFTAVIYILSPFIEYGLLFFLDNKPEGYPHILPGWNPLDKKHVIFYIVMVLVEVVAALYCVFMHVAFDSACIGVMIYVCGQFATLKLQCTKIGGRGRLYICSQRDARAHSRIIKCHQTHTLLVETIKGLDKLLRNILGLYFFISTLTLCTVAIRITSEHMSVMQILTLLQYMCGTLTQLFLFCSYGDAVFNESFIGPGEGPFSAAIWSLSPKIRREIAILGFGMMLPRTLHAGPFNRVDLPTFIQIVRAAYSYYAVLGKSKAA